MYRFLSLLFLAALSFSCRFDDPPPASTGQGLAGGVTSISCKVNKKAFDEFYTKLVTSDLDCLEQNLKTYATVNQSRDINIIDEDELTSFLRTFFQDSQNLERGVKDLFTISHLLFNNPKNQIPVIHLDQLFGFLKELNIRIIPVYQAFQLIDKDNIAESIYRSNRSAMESSLAVFSLYMTDFLKRNFKGDREFNIDDLLDFAKSEKSKKIVEDIRHLAFVKILFLGGEQESINLEEIFRAMDKLPNILKVGFDVLMASRVRFDDDLGAIPILQTDLKILSKLIYHESGNEKYFLTSDLVVASHRFEDAFLDLSKFEESVFQIKESTIIGGGRKYFDYKSIKKVLSHVKYGLDLISVYIKMWNANEAKLVSKHIVQSADLVDVKITGPRLLKFRSDFKRIISDYKYYRGNKKVAHYGKSYERNLKGVIELGVFEYVVKEFFHAFNKSGSDKQITKGEFEGIIIRFKDFVTEMKLWRNPVFKMINSNFLMAEYFRHQSVQDGVVNLKEVVEIINMELTAFHLAKQVFPKIQKLCIEDSSCTYDDHLEAVPTLFAYEKFFENYIIQFMGNFPDVYNLYMKLDKKKKVVWARSIAKFTRQCPYDYADGANEIPIREKDIILMMGGLMSIEEAFLFLDKSPADGVLTYPEIEVATGRFHNAIKDFLKKPNAKPGLTRLALYYLIHYKKAPPKGKLLKTLLQFGKIILKDKTKFRVTRFDLAELVANFAQPEAKPHPDCYIKNPKPDSWLVP